MDWLIGKIPFEWLQNPLVWGAAGSMFAGCVAVIVAFVGRVFVQMYNQPRIAGRMKPLLQKLPGAVQVHQVKELDPSLGRNALYDALAWHLSQNMNTSNDSCQLFLKTDTKTGTDNLHLCAKPGEYLYMSGFTVRLREIDRGGPAHQKEERERIFEVTYPAGSGVKIQEKMLEIVAAHKLENEIKQWVPSNRGGRGWQWQEAPFGHPMLLDNVKMSKAMRAEIEHIISNFSRKDWYGRHGAVWKTGFFLYGPPGSGKSSLVAALANKRRCDVYNLSLKELTDEGLISLNTQMKSRGIVLIEDADTHPVLLDRSKKSVFDETAEMKLEHQGRSTKLVPKRDSLQLTTVLNVMDGMLSTSSAGRIFVITTNEPDKLDPALYRAGRLDHHFRMDRSSVSEIEFICESIPCALIGMNAPKMAEYIQFVADRLLMQLGHSKLYGAKNPFGFMDMVSMRGKTSFFEGRESNYERAFVGLDQKDQEFGLDADF